MEGGGAHRNMINVANYLIKEGFKIDILLATKQNDLHHLIDDGVGVKNFGCSRVRYSLPPLLKYLRRNQPDILLATPYRSAIIAGLGHFFMKKDIPTTLRVPVTLSNEQFYTSPEGLSDYVLPKMISYTHTNADSLIAISNGVKEDLVKNFDVERDMVDVIYNPVITDEVYSLMKEPVDHPYFRTGLPVYIGVGRLTAQKNFSSLIRAFYKVQKERKSKLIILGKGNEKKKLKRIAKSHGILNDVSFVGFVRNPYKYVYNSDVFVLSSKWEGFGNVIVEALACQTNVVSTNCESGPSEILENGKYGDLVPTDNNSRLAKKMIEANDKKTENKKLNNRAQDFHVKNIVPQYRSHLLEQIK